MRQSGWSEVLRGTGIRALVFDLDGTLYRQEPVRRAMTGRLLAAMVARPREGWTAFRAVRAYRRAQESLRGVACPEADGLAAAQVRVACRATGLSEERMAAVAARWMDEAPLDLLAPATRDGLHDLLACCRERGLRLAVWSDYPARRKLQAMGLDSLFDTVVSAQDPEVQRFKPDPRGLEVALARLHVTRDEALYIGDRPEVDGAAARQAGVRCLIVGRQRPASASGLFSLAHYSALTHFIRGLEGRSTSSGRTTAHLAALSGDTLGNQ